MTPYLKLSFILYIAISVTNCELDKNQPCYGHQANYDTQKVLGSWNVVAIIPNRGLPTFKRLSCYKMDVSETDEVGLKWLISKKVDKPSQDIIQTIKGIIIRQRFHTEKPFDIWSRAVYGINGCFRELFMLDTNKTSLYDSKTLITNMQLHMMDSNDGTGPYLIQMLWGKFISAVIYRREEGVTMQQLDPINRLVQHVKGYQNMPTLICTKLEQELEQPAFQRP